MNSSSPALSDSVVSLTLSLAEKSDSDSIVVISERPERINEIFLNKPFKVYVTYSRLQLILRRKRLLATPENNIYLKRLRDIDSAFLEDKIVVCCDYFSPNLLNSLFFRQLRKTLRNANFSITELGYGRILSFLISKLLFSNRSGTLRDKLNTEMGKPDSVVIGGRYTNIFHADYRLQPALAIIAQYNEADIIEATIKHLLSQGADVYIIDNWSNDGSYESILRLKDKNPHRIFVERYPNTNTGKYEWEKLLKRVEQVAATHEEYEWIIFNDADELRWSPWPDISLRRALSFIGSLGYNCIDYTVFNFAATEDGFRQGINPLKFFNYGEFGAEDWYFLQLKTWRNNPKAKIAASGGHLVEIPGRKVFPLKFLIGHYPLRSSTQAKKKIFKDRQPRFTEEEKGKGWHIQYKGAKSTQDFIKDQAGLMKLSLPQDLTKYALQRTLGVGIRRK